MPTGIIVFFLSLVNFLRQGLSFDYFSFSFTIFFSLPFFFFFQTGISSFYHLRGDHSLSSFQSSSSHLPVRLEFLGSIPKCSTRQPSLTNASPAGRYEFELRRICRFHILQARAESIMQQIALDHFDRAATVHAKEHYYPMLALSHGLTHPNTPSLPSTSINRHSFVNDTLGLLNLCQTRRGFISNRSTHYRRQLANLFPRRVWVPAEWRLHLRFLSFHCLDYQDRLVEDERINNRKRKAIDTPYHLSSLVLDSPSLQSVAVQTDAPPRVSSVSTVTDISLYVGQQQPGPSNRVVKREIETDNQTPESRSGQSCQNPIHLE